MGIYYKAVCEERCEYIDPGRIADADGESWGRQQEAIVNGPAGRVISLYAANGGWSRTLFRFVNDTGPDYAVYERTWESDLKDVTAEAVDNFNSWAGPDDGGTLRVLDEPPDSDAGGHDMTENS